MRVTTLALVLIPLGFSEVSAQKVEVTPPDVISLLDKVARAAPTLTVGDIAALKADDPFLVGLYQWGVLLPQPEMYPPTRLIDQDIFHRTEAFDIFQTLFHQPPVGRTRWGVLNWIATHRDIPWARDFMEEALRVYTEETKDNENAWDYSERTQLERLITMFGDRSHMWFFDDLRERNLGTPYLPSYLNRLALEDEQKKGAITGRVSGDTSSLKFGELGEGAGEDPETANQAEPDTRLWMVLGIAAVLAVALALSRMKRS